MTQEKKKFDAEVGKILHLMIHSLYTNKEIFVRELISNASDACDKLRYLSQTESSLKLEDPNFKITVKIDKEKRTISFRDNGIGMNKEDLISNLGTIARSGTQNFLSTLSGDAKKDNMLIGQFGVGFYSSFMVADNIIVTSKKAGDDNIYTWQSTGEGDYTIDKISKDFSTGTEITLHIKQDSDDYLDHFRLKHIIKTYSDHIAIPIYFIDENNEENKLNSSSALWTRSKTEISDAQYEEFYQNVAYAADKPWVILHNKNEGAIEFINLLFIPSTKTFDLFHPDRKRRVKLYIKRVFISDENVDLVPQYLRFLRGIVDSESLPLNISRETLQHSATIAKIKDAITTRVLSELKKRKEQDIESYYSFWNNFGAALKEGLCEATTNHEQILDTCLFYSALQNKLISLDDYIKSCKDEHKTIYYLSGENTEKLRNSPQIEGFLSKGIDVLLFTDTVDDFWVNINSKYKDIEIKSVTRSDININEAEEEKKDKENTQEEYSKLISYIKEVLNDSIKDVKISKKLTSSPACLAVAEGSMDIRMERFLIEQKQLQQSSAKILEINPAHKIIDKINKDLLSDIKSSNNDALVKLIFDQACIIEGEPVLDVSDFAKRMNELLEKVI